MQVELEEHRASSLFSTSTEDGISGALAGFHSIDFYLLSSTQERPSSQEKEAELQVSSLKTPIPPQGFAHAQQSQAEQEGGATLMDLISSSGSSSSLSPFDLETRPCRNPASGLGLFCLKRTS